MRLSSQLRLTNRCHYRGRMSFCDSCEWCLPHRQPQSSGEAWLQLYFSPFQRFSRPKRHRPASTSQLRVSQNRGNCLFEWEVTDGVLFSSPSNNGLAEMHNDLRPVYFGTRKSGKELKGIYFYFLFYRGNLQSLNIIFFSLS